MIPVKVREIAYDINMNPVILLIDEHELKALPIWIGPIEAHAIAVALQGINLDNPQTTDLVKNILDLFDSKLSMVVINDVSDGIYFSKMHIWRHGKELIIDARPSDAIALAISTEVPIYLTEKVAQESMAIKDLLGEEQQQDLQKIPDDNTTDNLKKLLH